MKEPAGLAGSSLYNLYNTIVYRLIACFGTNDNKSRRTLYEFACVTLLSALEVSETGCGKIPFIIDDRPDSSRFQINPVGTKFITGFIRAEHKFPDAADVHIYGIDPAAILIPGDQG